MKYADNGATCTHKDGGYMMESGFGSGVRSTARKNKFCAKDIGRICAITVYAQRWGTFRLLPETQSASSPKVSKHIQRFYLQHS